MISWIATGVVLAYTLYMMWWIARLRSTWLEGDYSISRVLISKTMRRVGLWQITLGLAFMFVGPTFEVSSTIMLVGVGCSILLLDWAQRKFDSVI